MRRSSRRSLLMAGLAGPVLLTALALAQGPPPPPPPLGGPLPGLTKAQLKQFNDGRGAFLEAETPPEGLGPVFTEAACAICHNAGAPGGSGDRLVMRIGRLANGQFDPMIEFGGPLIQDRGIGRFKGVNFVGETVPRQATIVARRRTVPLFGLGLVDAVPDAAFVAIAEDEALHNPRTAGRVGPVLDPASGHARPGRFGWKAQQPSLFAFAGDAYANEMGVTTPLFPAENCPQGNCALLAANPAKTQPNDTTIATILQLTDFMTLLAPPPPGPFGPNERAGQAVFVQIGCAECHQPVLQTGPSPVPALNHVGFAPYSDFLLHDMGSLGDGIVQNTAGGSEMRTAPLWGLRFQRSLLHDGRARTATDAILAHDGQARTARTRFAGLGAAQRAQLLAFLNAL